MKLNAKALGMASGVLWSLTMFFMTLISVYTGYAADWLGVLVSIYPGYEITLLGSFFGLIYGFIDGFVGFFLLGWLYNRFAS